MIQLASGMYIWPSTRPDVCTIFTLGKQPSMRDCLMIENVPEMIACTKAAPLIFRLVDPHHACQLDTPSTAEFGDLIAKANTD